MLVLEGPMPLISVSGTSVRPPRTVRLRPTLYPLMFEVSEIVLASRHFVAAFWVSFGEVCSVIDAQSMRCASHRFLRYLVRQPPGFA